MAGESTSYNLSGNTKRSTAIREGMLILLDDVLQEDSDERMRVGEIDDLITTATSVQANTSHRSSDGKTHADVVLNNNHRSSDGKNHADVVLNNAHRATTSGNPHSVSKSDVGLGNADNTSDANKPISSATQAALNSKEDADATILKQADVVDLLTSESATAPLSANKGKTLKDAQDSIASRVTAIEDSEGAADGIATLDGTGKVPSSQLPSYVDDVAEYADFASFPTTGETGKIYVAIDTSKTYRWSGSAYVELKDDNAVWGNIEGTLSNQTDLNNALSAKEVSANRVTAFQATPDDTHYPSEKLVDDTVKGLAGTGRATETVKANADAVALRELLANKKTSLADDSDTFYPSQKAVKTVTDALDTRLDTAETGIVNNTQLIASKDQANLNAHNSITKRLAIAEAETYNGTDLENTEPTNEVGVATDGTDISASVEDGSIAVETEGKSFENLIENGDFETGDTTGWTSIASSSAVSNSVLSNTGDGTQAYSYLQQGTAVIGDVYFISFRARVTNSDCTALACNRPYGTGFSVSTPTINEWYILAGVVTADQTAGIRIVHTYADAATANGKVMQVDGKYGVRAYNLTALGLDTTLTTTALCDAYFNYVDGLRSSLSHDVESTDKNVFDKTKVTRGYKLDTDGTLTASATDYTSDYMIIRPSVDWVGQDEEYAFYDSNFNFISYGTGSGAITAPANALYERISSALTTLDTMQIEQASSATTYKAFNSNHAHCPVTLNQVPTAKDTFNFKTGVHGVNTATGALSSELIPSFDFTSGWGILGTVTINDADTFTSTGAGGITLAAQFTVGKLYAISCESDSALTDIYHITPGSALIGNADGKTYYFIASGSGLYIRNSDSATANISSISIKEITTTAGTPKAVASQLQVIDDGTTAIYELADASKYTVQYPPQNLIGYKGGQISRIPKLRSNGISVAGTVPLGTIPISRMGDVYEYIGAESSLVDPADITLASDGLSFDVAGGGDDEVYDYVAFYDTSYSTYPTQQIQYTTDNVATKVAMLMSVLAGGTTGQVLSKVSDDDYDFAWVTP